METFIEILSYLPVVEAVPYLLFYYGASVLRMLKTKSSNDVSIIGWTVAFSVQVCYIFYGLLIVKEWQYIASCFCATAGTGAVLITALYYRYRRNETNVTAARLKDQSTEKRYHMATPTFDVYIKKDNYLLTLPDRIELTKHIKTVRPEWAEALYIENENVKFLLSQKGKLYIGDDTGHIVEAPDKYEARPVRDDIAFEKDMSEFIAD